jgi:predicted RNA-binding protein with RPS1 domain
VPGVKPTSTAIADSGAAEAVEDGAEGVVHLLRVGAVRRNYVLDISNAAV